MGKKYKIKYDIGEWDGGEIRAQGAGGTDAMLVASVVRSEDGGSNTAFISVDGSTGEDMMGVEIFKVFTCLAHELSKRRDIPSWQQTLASQTFEAVRAVILDARINR